MFLQYVIDGYNIINHPQFARLHKKIKKDCRNLLLEFIRTKRLTGSPKNKITVVFDGYSQVPQFKENKDIDVVFSRKETADKKMKKIVEASSNPKNIVVVSDDKEIIFFVKSVGARCISVEEFINSKENLRQAQRKDMVKAELTYSQIHQINQEFKKIWLK